MSTAYWAQFSHQELMSLQGVELDDPDLCQDEDDAYLEQLEKEAHCCGNCMDCLGLSWSDFL